MTRAAHIQPIATGGRPPEVGHVIHYQILQRSVFGACLGESGAFDEIQCSVFSSRTNHSDPEPNWYIYHSDHLGSSAFLTDAAGDPTQHLQYMPFGETFVEQRSVTSYYTPYTFSAKKRDTETGYSYFGARYYDADISVWLSVDPMADKYPSMSAYMYVGGHPTIITDPDGRDWIQDENGNYVYDKTITKDTKLKEGQTYIGKTGSINVVNSEGESLYKYSLNEDGSFTDSRGKKHESGSGTFDPKFKSGHKIVSPTITERAADVFSNFNVGYIADNQAQNQLAPITTKLETRSGVVSLALIGYISVKSPVTGIFSTSITTIIGCNIAMSKENSEAYAKQGMGKGIYAANIVGPGVPIPRTAMFAAHDGSFIGWHPTTIKGVPDMNFYDYQRLLKKTRNL